MFFIKHLVFVLSVLSFVHSTPNCGENEVYTNCMSPCKLQHCKHLKQSPDCDTNIKCQPGCECIQHFLRNSDNFCISSEICEEYDSQFDPEKDIDIILNESDDDEASLKEHFYDVDSSKDADTEDDDINEIEDNQSFDDELKNGFWVIEQTDHIDTNQEPNTDQMLSSKKDIKTVDNNENIEQSKQNYVINAPLPTFSSDQPKLSDEKSGVDTEGSTERQNVQAPENEVEPTTEMKLKPEEIESNRTETNNQGNTKFNQNFDETLETSTLPQKNELPIRRPITEVYPEDKKETNQWREPTRLKHDEQPNKTRPEQNTDQSQESTNMPENNGWPNRRPEAEEYPENKKDTHQWREPPKPWHDEHPTKTRPEQNTDQSQESSNIAVNNGWPNRRPETEVYPEDKKDTNRWRAPPRPRHDEQPNKRRPEQNTGQSQESSNMPEHDRWPNRRPETEVYPEDREDTNQWRAPPRPWHDELPYTTSRPEHTTKRWHPYPPPRKWHGSNRHKRPRSRDNQITVIYPIPVYVKNNSNHRHTYPDTNPKYIREHERGYERNHDPERRRENEYDRNHEPDRRRENEYDRNHEPDRRSENRYDRGGESERRRENEYGHNRSSHRRSRTWCRRYPGDKRRPCPWYKTKPWYRPKHDSHPDYKNKERNSNHNRSNRRPKRVCRRQRNGKTVCYVPKSYKRTSRRN